MDSLISVIIPVYNVEKYLPRCLESVINQTYRNIEIIVVDDGSHDNCGKICDEYALKDDRIIVIHKKNAGVSCARNDGIETAKGRYICFVDSDDYVMPDYVEKLYKALVDNDADIVTCDYYRNAGNELMKDVSADFPFQVIENDCQFFYDKSIIEFRAQVPWNKIFKADIISENNVRFLSDIPLGEDSLFVIEYIEYAERACFIEEKLYVYTDSDTSVCKSSEKRSFFDNTCKLIDYMDVISDRSSSEYYKKSLQLSKMMCQINLLYDNKKFKLKKDVKKVRKDIMNNMSLFLGSALSLRVKLRYLLMAVSPSLFDALKTFWRKNIRYKKVEV